ncbi:RNA polymerase sigma factor, partial [Streptomyces sp. NPDC006643]|uniref:RNA polymerase sigma factor n=1 Tax=Streptomyces sp. NPDC006643 TaxID=3364756 RepID=UPI0036C658E7
PASYFTPPCPRAGGGGPPPPPPRGRGGGGGGGGPPPPPPPHAWSETFLAAMRAYPDLPDDANVEAWLVTIAHRKAIDITRAGQRHAVPVADLPERPSAVGLPGETDHDLWRAVKALPEKQRQAVAYHHFAGLPYREIAQIVGGTPQAVRRAASDGVKALRTTLSAAPSPGGSGS